MVRIEKIKVNGKVYFKLVHNIRKGNKITHKSKYLGKRIPTKARLDQLKKEFLEEIQGQRFKYFSSNDLEKIEKKKEQYTNEQNALSEIEKKNQAEEFAIRFTYDSSKLSGAAITLRQTSLILKEGIMPKDIKSIRTARELENHKNGVTVITKYRGTLHKLFIKKLHKVLFLGIDDQIAGILRDELKRNVKIAGTTYVPPKWQDLSKELEQFFKWYKAESRKIHPVELAALIHLKIITMQPFIDGNSRLSRLLMNWILWKKGYPLIDIPIEDLENYYNALDKYQIEKQEKPFVKYMMQYLLKA